MDFPGRATCVAVHWFLAAGRLAQSGTRETTRNWLRNFRSVPIFRITTHTLNNEASMAAAKVVVLYPVPTDVAAFDRAYADEHAPMVTTQNFPGMTRFIGSGVVGTADGSVAPFHRVVELHYPSMEALQASAASPTVGPVVGHAIAISTGGMPTFLIVQEDDNRSFS